MQEGKGVVGRPLTFKGGVQARGGGKKNPGKTVPSGAGPAPGKVMTESEKSPL